MSPIRHILVVDDDPEIRAMAVKGLEAEIGAVVHQAEDGYSAKMLLKTVYYDVVVTEVILPRVDGIELIIHLHAYFPTTRVVAISDGGRKLNAEAALAFARALKVAGILLKPFAASDLVTIVQQALNR